MLLKIIIVALLSSLITAPFWVGLSTQATLQRWVGDLNTLPYLRASLQNYELGYTTSRAQLSLQAVLQNNEIRSQRQRLLETVKLDLHIAHGPLLMKAGQPFGQFRIAANLAPNSPLAEQLRRDLKLERPIRLSSSVGFSGQSQTSLRLDSFILQDTPLNIRFGGAKLDITTSDNGKQVNYWARMAGSQFQLATLAIDTSDVQLSGSYQGEGKMRLTLPRIQMAGATRGVFEDFALSLYKREESEAIELRLKANEAQGVFPAAHESPIRCQAKIVDSKLSISAILQHASHTQKVFTHRVEGHLVERLRVLSYLRDLDCSKN